jgi:hypothetical protein
MAGVREDALKESCCGTREGKGAEKGGRGMTPILLKPDEVAAYLSLPVSWVRGIAAGRRGRVQHEGLT